MIEIRTTFDLSATTALQKMQLRKMRLFIIFFVLILVFIGIMNIFNDEVGTGIMFILIGLLYVPLVRLLTKVFTKKTAKSTKFMSEQTSCYFKLDDNKMYQEVVREDELKQTYEGSYSLVYKAVETPTHFLCLFLIFRRL